MDASGLLRLTCAINAFGARGDSGPAPPAAGARAAANKAAGFLTRRLVFGHLRGDGITLDLAGLRDLAQGLDELVALGDGLRTGLAGAEVVTLWTLRLELQQRMAAHAGGDAAARGLDLSPVGQAAWAAAEAAASGMPETPHWPPRPAVPAVSVADPGDAGPATGAVEARHAAEQGGGAAPSPRAAAPEEAMAFADPPPPPPVATDAGGGPVAADKPRASLGLFSRAILRLHDAVESMAPPPRPEDAEEAGPLQGEASVRPG